MRIKICGIYKITNPKKKIYIGQSNDCYQREWYYRGARCPSQIKIYNSIKKYGWEKHRFEIIHQCQPEELNVMEKYYVDLYQTFNSEFGLNLKDGGGNYAKMSEETKRKMSVIMKGRKRSDELKAKLKAQRQNVSLETRRRMSVAGKGRIFTEGHKRKIGLAHKGRTISLEMRERISKTLTGRKLGPHSEEHRKRIALANTGKKRGKMTPEQLAAHTERCIGKKNGMYGKTQSPETREKIRQKQKEAFERVKQEKLTMIF